MIAKAVRIWRDEGALVLRGRATRFARRRLRGAPDESLPVAAADVLAVEASLARPAPPRRPPPRDGRLRIDWVIPAIGPGAGGHANILRFVRGLDARGHRSRLFVYDPHGFQTAAEARAITHRAFGDLRAEIHHGVAGLGDCDALVATAWQTAYPVVNARTDARRFYWVQDHEPDFHPAGSTSALAAATYDFGLHGITLGPWLAEKLAAEHGMPCEHYPFGLEPGTYRLDPAGGPRDKVVFYARPHTPRRGFELGIMALELLAAEHPELELHLLGGDLGGRELPFPAVRHGILTPAELNSLYNGAVAGLVLSFTNASLLPLELLAAGCVPVVNAAACARAMGDAPGVAYADPTPHALARAVRAAVEHHDRDARAREIAHGVRALGWGPSIDRVEEILRTAVGAAARPEVVAA